MPFEAKLNARQAYKIETAIERATATVTAVANLVERFEDAETAESVRLVLNDLRQARFAMQDAGFGVRDLPSVVRPRGEAAPMRGLVDELSGEADRPAA